MSGKKNVGLSDEAKQKIAMLKANVLGITTANKVEELQDIDFKNRINAAYGQPSNTIMPAYNGKDQHAVDLFLSVYNHKHINGDGRKAIITYLNQLKQQADDTFIG